LVYPSEAQSFVKVTLTRVSDCDSSRVILCKMWLESSYHFVNMTRVEPESVKIVTRVESLTRVKLSLQTILAVLTKIVMTFKDYYQNIF